MHSKLHTLGIQSDICMRWGNIYNQSMSMFIAPEACLRPFHSLLVSSSDTCLIWILMV